MQDYLRCDTLEQIDQAWREAALGTSDQTKRHIGAALERLNQAVGRSSESAEAAQAVRGYLESARAAVQASDSLGVVLALVAAMQALEHTARNEHTL